MKLDLNKLNNLNHIDSKLEYIYDLIDELGFSNQFSEIDIIFENVDVNNLEPTLLVGLLSISHVWKKNLEKYYELYDKIEQILKIKHPDRYKKILIGLR